PKRLLVTTNSSGTAMLYVAEDDRIEAFAIADNGGLQKLGQVQRQGMVPYSIAISPNRNVLYAQQNAESRIIAQPLDAQGAPTGDFTSCVLLPTGGGERNLLVYGSYLYVSSFSQVAIFGIDANGDLFGADDNGVPVPGDPTLCSDSAKASDRT